MLTEQEIRELREMGESATLREEFRILQRNSRERAQRMSVDDLARWLTAINRICPGDPMRRKLMVGDNFKF